jgi:Xaa-Pro dipeptidase
VTTHTQYASHLRTLQRRYDVALAATGFDAVIVGAGVPVGIFADDQDHPYRPDPRFVQWAPLLAHPGSLLAYRPGQRPQLCVHAPDDFWHQSAPVPAGEWEQRLDIHPVADRRVAAKLLRRLLGRGRTALLGDPRQWQGLGLGPAVNPPALVTYLDYDRATKTAWEVDNLRAANRLGIRAHAAVAQGYAQGLSEYELGLVFLAACGQTDAELPYPAIIAANENGATLHYQHRRRTRLPAAQRRSLLVDAGCSVAGYASDITRTLAARPGEFATMVADLERAQQRLARRVAPGAWFGDLQLAAHEELAGLLARWELVRLSPEAIVTARITDHFFPHGLGHLLGLQVHDVGGDLAGPGGGSLPKPPRFPRLRLTRRLEPGYVVTIEPGLYFIDSLLARLRRSRHGRHVDWRRVDALRPYGGIRIEDDVLVTEDGHENLTRGAAAAVAEAPA